ncbi:MAG: GIY-YIG nuclease family protein, partial [Oscillospiraceae bacterium]
MIIGEENNPRLPYLRDKTSKLTGSPGCYIMKDQNENIIYIGKAKNLRNRVTSYFRKGQDHLPKVWKMVSHVYDYEFIVTDSEFEALVLECSLIKQYTPKYNILLKDDKGYSYIRVTNEPFPRLQSVLQKYDDGAEYIGPYTSSFAVKQAVIEANKVFMLPTCNRKFPQDFNKARPCLNHHIKQCMGVCTGKISQEEYNNAV